jgi:hypothetical protein
MARSPGFAGVAPGCIRGPDRVAYIARSPAAYVGGQLSQQSDGVIPDASSGGTLPFPENGGTEEQQEYRRRLEQTDLAAYASSDEELE